MLTALLCLPPFHARRASSDLFQPHPTRLPNRSQKTASGIFLPSTATANPLPEATVIAVGPGAADAVRSLPLHSHDRLN
jgi:hypothetical protein